MIAVTSSPSLELWNFENMWKRGIGGSETAHAELSEGLKLAGFDVHSFSPMRGEAQSPAGVVWKDTVEFNPATARVLVNFRQPELFDLTKPAGASWWFCGQDTGYPNWTDERIAKVDRYICLCETQARQVQSYYSQFRGKTYISSNGVRSKFIEDFEKNGGATNPVTGEWVEKRPRNQKRILYASSPDRGLKLILENWFRIREKVPDAELHCAYGFENMARVVEIMGAGDWRAGYQRELEALLTQPGVTFTGRLNQLELYREWFEASVWFHPTDFPETSCITCMDAMATGCWPITNNYWAIGENVGRVGAGDLFSGIPQKSALIKSYMIETLCDRLNNGVPEGARREMMEKARKMYNWSNIVTQWSNWISEDLKK